MKTSERPAKPAPRAGLDVTDAQEVSERRRKERVRRFTGRTALYLTAITAAVLAAAPFLWGTVTMFKQDADLYRPDNNPFIYNRPPTPTTSRSCSTAPTSRPSLTTPCLLGCWSWGSRS